MTAIEPTAIIGDIHGGHDRLRALLRDPVVANRALVFVGDYVNRGADSRAVVDLLAELHSNWHAPTTFLCGNHDQAFLEVLQGGPITPLLQMGGGATVRSWVPDVEGDVAEALRQAVTEAQLEFFVGLEHIWMRPGVVAAHSRDQAAHSQTRGSLLVVGHHIQHDGEPKIVDDCAYIDTGCGTTSSGPLSALLLPELQFITH